VATKLLVQILTEFLFLPFLRGISENLHIQLGLKAFFLNTIMF
jgi:hypothetical protein